MAVLAAVSALDVATGGSVSDVVVDEDVVVLVFFRVFFCSKALLFRSTSGGDARAHTTRAHTSETPKTRSRMHTKSVLASHASVTSTPRTPLTHTPSTAAESATHPGNTRTHLD